CVPFRVVQAGHRSRYGIAGGTLIREEFAGTERDKLGLIVHVLAAASNHTDHSHCQQRAHLGGGLNTAPPKLAKDENSQENAWSRRGDTVDPAIQCTEISGL